MAASREDAVIVLLRALPAELTDRVLKQLKPKVAERLRGRMRTANGSAGPDRLNDALRDLADVRRISERPGPAASVGTRFDALVRDGEVDAKPEPEPKSDDPIQSLRALAVERLLPALQGEQPPTVAAVMSCLEPAAAAELLKRLPPETRADVALRSGRPAPRNKILLERLARAVLERSRNLATAEPEPTDDDRFRRFATLLRALSRPERLGIFQQLEQSDPETAEKVNELLYQFDDLLRLDNRAMQGLLAELDMKTLALALQGADEGIRAKAQTNLSSRAREALAEETELIGNAPKTKIEAARAAVLAVLRRLDEEGKLTLEG